MCVRIVEGTEEMGRVLKALNRLMILIIALFLLGSSIMLYEINDIQNDMRESLTDIELILDEIK